MLKNFKEYINDDKKNIRTLCTENQKVKQLTRWNFRKFKIQYVKENFTGKEHSKLDVEEDMSKREYLAQGMTQSES